MTKLSALKFVEVDASQLQRGSATPRSKFVQAVSEQLEAIAAKLDGKPYVKKRMVTKEIDGVKQKVESTKRFNAWFAQLHDGFWYINVRYGNRPLAIVDSKSWVKCGDKPESVVNVLETLRDAANAGELDKQLNEAQKKGSRKGTKKKA